ncbi:EpsG family protein [Limosilactobacillus fermentum]|uniref:EpsG family protein n=1 Tax=Limosilactobacillus fermentum TaxID=1613 RepID=UPI0021A3CF3E|nr:EpsG family protein [Limosilactobacillus fermentum]MCT2872725.1 EpsG family protein [Limosilactobacillus fermentum]
MIYLTVLIVGLLITALRVNSRIIQVIYALCALGTMAYLMGTVDTLHSFDTSAYEYMYSYLPSTHRFEAGYMNLTYWFYSHNVPYVEFRLISFAIFVVIMFMGIRLLTNNWIAFYSLYLIFPFFMDVTQVRQFFMFSLVIFGSGIIARYKGKLSFLVGALIIILSCEFQSSGIVYVLLLFLMRFNYKKLLHIGEYLLWIESGLAVLLHFSNGNRVIQKALSVIVGITGRSDTESIISLYSQGSSFSRVTFYIMSIILGFYVYRLLINSISEEVMSLRVRNVTTSMLLVGIIFIITLAGSADFERFLRGSIVAMIIVFANYMDPKNIIPRGVLVKRWALMFIALLLFTTSWKYWDSSNEGRLQYLPYIIRVSNGNEVE